MAQKVKSAVNISIIIMIFIVVAFTVQASVHATASRLVCSPLHKNVFLHQQTRQTQQLSSQDTSRSKTNIIVPSEPHQQAQALLTIAIRTTTNRARFIRRRVEEGADGDDHIASNE